MNLHGVPAMLAVATFALSPAVASGADIFKGKDVYQLHCASCHGDDGKGVVAGTEDLTRPGKLMQADVELARKLKDGVPGMPAYRGMLTEAEVRDVIAYMRTLR